MKGDFNAGAGSIYQLTGGSREIFVKILKSESESPLRQAQGPPFDRLRDHPSTGSGTPLRQAQGPPFDRLSRRVIGKEYESGEIIDNGQLRIDNFRHGYSAPF